MHCVYSVVGNDLLNKIKIIFVFQIVKRDPRISDIIMSQWEALGINLWHQYWFHTEEEILWSHKWQRINCSVRVGLVYGLKGNCKSVLFYLWKTENNTSEILRWKYKNHVTICIQIHYEHRSLFYHISIVCCRYRTRTSVLRSTGWA